MDKTLFKGLLAARRKIVSWKEGTPSFRVASFADTEMDSDAIPGTPFRTFEAVPQKRKSRRKQNDSFLFDPYSDTLFDYPNIVKQQLDSPLDAIEHFNLHLTVQIPYCPFACWHCYNPKDVCETGEDACRKVSANEESYTAEQILEHFVEVRKKARVRGQEYNVLRISGGEPFLVPDLIGELLDLISCGSNDNYPKVIWTETNLATWAQTTDGKSVFSVAEGEYKEKKNKSLSGILESNKNRLVVHPCFHGLSDENIRRVTKLAANRLRFSDFEIAMRQLHTHGLHLYPTFLCEASDPSRVENLFDMLYAIDKSYPLKTALVSVDYYG